MAVGDLTWTKIGTFFDSTIVAGLASLNSGAATAKDDTTSFFFIPLENGQIMVMKAVRAAA